LAIPVEIHLLRIGFTVLNVGIERWSRRNRNWHRNAAMSKEVEENAVSDFTRHCLQLEHLHPAVAMLEVQ
jgi:hypothetical protein